MQQQRTEEKERKRSLIMKKNQPLETTQLSN